MLISRIIIEERGGENSIDKEMVRQSICGDCASKVKVMNACKGQEIPGYYCPICWTKVRYQDKSRVALSDMMLESSKSSTYGFFELYLGEKIYSRKITAEINAEFANIIITSCCRESIPEIPTRPKAWSYRDVSNHFPRKVR